jgi:hypothetical protein
MMTKTVRHTLHAIGDHSGDFARTVGSGTVDLVRRVGGGTTSLAKQIGPRRALIGLAVLGVAIGGGVFLIRYLRARSTKDELGIGSDGADGSAERATSRNRSHAQRTDALTSH